MNKATSSGPVSARKVTLHELVIPELERLAEDQKFDKNVLILMQEDFVSLAMEKNMREFVKEINRIKLLENVPDVSKEDLHREKVAFLTKITNTTYLELKQSGQGFNVSSYVDVAQTFFQAEAKRYSSHLKDLTRHLQETIESGRKPNLQEHAQDAFVSISRIANTVSSLQKIGASADAKHVASNMRRAIDGLNFDAVTQPGISIPVGKQLLTLIDQMSKSPEKYIQFVEPHKLSTPKLKPWENESMRNHGMEREPSVLASPSL